MIEKTYYQRNRDEILNRAKYYYENDKGELKEQARDLSEEDRNLSEEKKKAKRENMEKTDIIICLKKRSRN